MNSISKFFSNEHFWKKWELFTERTWGVVVCHYLHFGVLHRRCKYIKITSNIFFLSSINLCVICLPKNHLLGSCFANSMELWKNNQGLIWTCCQWWVTNLISPYLSLHILRPTHKTSSVRLFICIFYCKYLYLPFAFGMTMSSTCHIFEWRIYHLLNSIWIFISALRPAVTSFTLWLTS